MRARSIRRSSASSSALKAAPAWTSRRSCGCSRRATPTTAASSPRPMSFAGRRAATPSAMSSTATSTTPTSAPTAARSAPSPRARRMRRCAARPMTSRSRKSCAAPARPGSEARPKCAFRAASIRDYTGETYLGICRAIKAAVPDMHIHAFSPLEVTQGAATLGLPIRSFLAQLKAAGLSTLPGTAAEILDDEVRAIICADKVNTARVARCRKDRAWSRPAHDVHDHVRAYRASAVLGAASPGAAGFAGGDGRLHRIRAVAVRAYGSADVSARARLGAGRPSGKRC